MGNPITPLARLSFPHVFVPTKVDPDDPTEKASYSTTLVFEAGTKGMAVLQKEALAVAKKRWGAKAAKLIKDGKIKMPFLTDEDGKWGYGEGASFIRCKSNRKPAIVTRAPDPTTGKPMHITEDQQDELIYAGAHVFASVRPYAWQHKTGGMGVSFGLGNLQWVKHGEHYDGSLPADEEFEVDEDLVGDLSDLEDSDDEDDEDDEDDDDEGALAELFD